MALGCSQWTTARFGGNKPIIGTPPLSADTVVVETAFLKVSLDDTALEREIWESCDELVVSADLRRKLAANGIRVGVLGSTVPQGFRKLIDQQASQNPLDTPPDSQVTSPDKSDVTTRVQVIHCRPGKRTRIVTSIEYPELSCFETDDQGAVHGETLYQAVCQLGLKVAACGDGTAKVELTPEIEHGETRNRFVAADGAFALQPARERRVIERLRAEAALSPGQFLLIGTSPEACGIGKDFFTAELNSTPRRTILVLRILQTQADDLFAPQSKEAPIVTRAIESTP